MKYESEGTNFHFICGPYQKTDCKHIGTQPEIIRNIYSTRKHWYPSIKCVSRLQMKIQSIHMWPVNKLSQEVIGFTSEEAIKQAIEGTLRPKLAL